MILECPSCRARFKVADAMIPPSGRTVRCSRCTNEWHVTRASEEAAAPPEPVIPVIIEDTPPPTFHEEPAVPEELSPAAQAEGEAFLSQLEAVISASEATMSAKPARGAKPAATRPAKPPRNAKPFKIAVPVLAALWLVLALITYFPSWMDMSGLSGIYSMFGVKPTDGLVFSDATMEREREGSKTKFILSGSIRNHSNATRKVPNVRVTLRDAKGKDLWGREYPVKIELKPGEVYPFRIKNVETVFASSVSSIVVDMGNPLQLMVR